MSLATVQKTDGVNRRAQMSW